MHHRASSTGLPLPLVLTGLGVCAYAIAVFWSSRHPSALTLILAAVPFVSLTTVVAKGAVQDELPVVQRVVRALPLVAVVLFLAIAWQPLLNNVRLVFLADHLGVHTTLCWLFARTLLPGRTPLCTEFASWVHEDMTSPQLLWYTRQVTKAWALFFSLTVLTSVVLFALAEFTTWIAFTTMVGPALTACFFLIENLCRSRFLPPKDRVGLAGTWRAVQARTQHKAPTPTSNEVRHEC